MKNVSIGSSELLSISFLKSNLKRVKVFESQIGSQHLSISTLVDVVLIF